MEGFWTDELVTLFVMYCTSHCCVPNSIKSPIYCVISLELGSFERESMTEVARGQ